VKKLDEEIISAVKRGVQVELITARNRDIPSYRAFKNANLMNHLVKNGVKVLQVQDKYLHMKGFLFDDQSLTFGSVNLDKWSWDNNNELNFCSSQPEHLQYFSKVYEKIRSETAPVENAPITLKLARRVQVFFWESFLESCNFVMNYRNKFKYHSKEQTMRRLWQETILNKRASTLDIPEESLRLYKNVNFDWDDSIGIDH
jgi:phosphatidylserine/phosphatidylglycerophosphate/cardiolipin synthase-like enzyme